MMRWRVANAPASFRVRGWLLSRSLLNVEPGGTVRTCSRVRVFARGTFNPKVTGGWKFEKNNGGRRKLVRRQTLPPSAMSPHT